jgi:hypothetical protein
LLISQRATPSNSRRPSKIDSIWIKSFSRTLATIPGQAPGFLVPLAVARVLGATGATDAFFLALAIMSSVLSAVSAATQRPKSNGHCHIRDWSLRNWSLGLY